jgi:hypothetical protein
MFYLLFFLILAVMIFLGFFLAKTKGESILEHIIRFSTVIFIALTMANLLLPDYFVCNKELPALSQMTGTKLQAMIRWLNAVCFTVLPIAVFQKNKYFEKIASLFCLPIAFINVINYDQYVEYFLFDRPSGLQTVRLFSESFKNFLVNEGFRAVFFGLLCHFQLVALILLTWKNRKKP